MAGKDEPGAICRRPALAPSRVPAGRLRGPTPRQLRRSDPNAVLLPHAIEPLCRSSWRAGYAPILMTRWRAYAAEPTKGSWRWDGAPPRRTSGRPRTATRITSICAASVRGWPVRVTVGRCPR